LNKKELKNINQTLNIIYLLYQRTFLKEILRKQWFYLLKRF